MLRLFSKPSSRHGQQLAHVRAWRRHNVALVKELWNQGVALKAICLRVGVNEHFVDHCIRLKIYPDAGPLPTPRRAYGANQKRRLRESIEVPG